MATHLPKSVLDGARALELFEGEASYYYPDGGATESERDHLVNVILKAAIEKLEAK